MPLFLGRLVQTRGPEGTLRRGDRHACPGHRLAQPQWEALRHLGAADAARTQEMRGDPAQTPASAPSAFLFSLMNSDRLSTSSTAACLRPRFTSEIAQEDGGAAVMREVEEGVGHVETRRVEHVGVALAGGDHETGRFAPVGRILAGRAALAGGLGGLLFRRGFHEG